MLECAFSKTMTADLTEVEVVVLGVSEDHEETNDVNNCYTAC